MRNSVVLNISVPLAETAEPAVIVLNLRFHGEETEDSHTDLTEDEIRQICELHPDCAGCPLAEECEDI